MNLIVLLPHQQGYKQSLVSETVSGLSENLLVNLRQWLFDTNLYL